MRPFVTLLLLGLSTAWPALAATVDIQIQANGFVPASATVAVGDSVRWTNVSGAAHNVVADDGSFNSGPPSSDTWQFVVPFANGGVVFYQSQGAGFLNGSITVQGLFADGYEVGSVQAWDGASQSFLPCNCYFSGDCPSNASFCNWGVLTSEDNCEWMENKPNNIPGNGCDVLYPGVGWIGGICDGVCEAAVNGSIPGGEDELLVAQAIRYWSAAILEPSLRPGGGPVDPVLAQKAQTVGFDHEEAAIQIGRQVADLLMLGGIPRFYDHFCHWEAHPDEPNPNLWVDLSAEPCKVAAARLLTEGLVEEMATPGSAGAVLERLPALCQGGWAALGQGQRCASGLTCFTERLEQMAIFLTTPPQARNLLQRALAHPAR